jgi:hypothetical protein
MNLLRFLFEMILEILKGILYRWILVLIDISRGIFLCIKRLLIRRKLSHWQKDSTNEGCGVISHPSFHRPDPLIYSQKYLLSLGLAVTWDNPDIVLLRNGVIVSEGDLLPNTEYEIRATVWNNSFDAPIVGLTVDFSFMSFGASTIITPIGTKAVNLGVKGGANHPALVSMMWTTPPAGHYCILVELKWVDDANPNNNLGQNNVNVVAALSPAIFTFDLRNNTDKNRAYRFAVDTYTLPDQKDCPEQIRQSSDNAQTWREIQALHNRNNYPIPPDWTVGINPPEAALIPGEEVHIEVSITPPGSFTGRKAFNVHAIMENGEFAGGVTVYVTKA